MGEETMNIVEKQQLAILKLLAGRRNRDNDRGGKTMSAWVSMAIVGAGIFIAALLIARRLPKKH